MKLNREFWALFWIRNIQTHTSVPNTQAKRGLPLLLYQEMPKLNLGHPVYNIWTPLWSSGPSNFPGSSFYKELPVKSQIKFNGAI